MGFNSIIGRIGGGACRGHTILKFWPMFYINKDPAISLIFACHGGSYTLAFRTLKHGLNLTNICKNRVLINIFVDTCLARMSQANSIPNSKASSIDNNIANSIANYFLFTWAVYVFVTFNYQKSIFLFIFIL